VATPIRQRVKTAHNINKRPSLLAGMWFYVPSLKRGQSGSIGAKKVQ